MSTESNVILITNDTSIAQILKPKLVLLREIDNISISNYTDATNSIKASFPDTILIHCESEKEDCLNLIKEIKSNEATQNTPVLIVVNEYDQDFLLSAYDNGISDFLTLKDDDAEILMRTIWCLKENALVNTVQKQHNLLEQLDIVESESDFYSAKYSDTVLENEFKLLNQRGISATLMAVGATEEGKINLRENQLAKAIKKSTRNSDIIAHGSSNKFYILLPKTNVKGALCVWDKIKTSIGDDSLINASAAEIKGQNFESIQKEVLNSLSIAEKNNRDIVILGEETATSSEDWLEKINANQKNFKLFKQAFNKKLEKVITPVFFQMQKLWEEKLFKTKIEQYSNSTLSSFSLKRLNKESELKITYPGFSKINIDIIHQGLDSPENKRIGLDLSELDEEKLTQILEEFINEFKNNANA